MKCRKRNCSTIISKLANMGVYCFVHQREIAEREFHALITDEDIIRWRKGVQVTKYIPITESLAPFIRHLKDKKTSIKKKFVNGEKCHALFRFS